MSWHSDNVTVVDYINHQGGLRSRPLYKLARHLLLWAQHNLWSVKAFHMLGILNQGADMLLQSSVSRRMVTPPPDGSDDLEYFEVSGS